HKAMASNEQVTRGLLCTTELDISNRSLGMFARAKKSADTFQKITGLAIALRENDSCKLLMTKKHKDSKKQTPEACVINYDSTATNEQINHYNQQSKICKQLALAMSNDIDKQLLSAHSIHKDFSRTAKLVKWG